MSKRSLRSVFFVAAALTLSPHSGKAAEPGACLDKNQINDILAKEGQSQIILAIQSPWAVEGKLVGNFMHVIFTSDAAGKTGYQLTEDGCKPDSLATEYSPGGRACRYEGRVASCMMGLAVFLLRQKWKLILKPP